jgi:hypoxanthine phosphoribosyltransferase
LYKGKKQKDTHHVGGLYTIPVEDYQNFIVVDDIFDTGVTLLNIIDLLYDYTAEINKLDYDEVQTNFIPAVVYSQQPKQALENFGILAGKKIKHKGGDKPWVVFPWD